MKNDKFEDLVLLVYNYVSIYKPDLENPNLHIALLDKFVYGDNRILKFIKNGFNLPYFSTNEYPEYNKLIFVVWNMLRGLSYDEAVNGLSGLNIVEIHLYTNIMDSQEQCDECEGDGNVSCSWCDGDGVVPCDYCTNGTIDCEDCDGTGEIEDETCSTCQGGGELKCNECDGEGEEACSSCDNGNVDCEICDNGMIGKEGYTTVTMSAVKLLVEMQSQSKDFLEKIQSGDLKNVEDISNAFENTLFYRNLISNENGMLKLSSNEDSVEYTNEDFEQLNINDGDIFNIKIYPFTH